MLPLRSRIALDFCVYFGACVNILVGEPLANPVEVSTLRREVWHHIAVLLPYYVCFCYTLLVCYCNYEP